MSNIPSSPPPPPFPLATLLAASTIVGSSAALLIMVVVIQMYFAQKGETHIKQIESSHTATLELPTSSQHMPYPDAPMGDPGVATILNTIPQEGRMVEPDMNSCAQWSDDDQASCNNPRMPPQCCFGE